MTEEIDVEAMLEEAVDPRVMKTYGNDDSSENEVSDGRASRPDSGDSDGESIGHKSADERRSRDGKSVDRHSNREESRQRSKSKERKSKDGSESRDHKSREVTRSRSKDREAKVRERSSSKNRDRDRDRDKDRKRKSRSRDRERRRRSRSRSRDRRRRSRSRERRRKSRSSSRDRHRRSRSRDRARRSRSRDRRRDEYLTPEERDRRTVFCMQLAARVEARDIEDFFSQIGKVKEVRLIMDHRSRRHKGICYVEFKAIETVAKALALTGTRLMGVPIVVQPSQAEKNRQTAEQLRPPRKPRPAALAPRAVSGPMALYVGSLHFNVTEDMLRGIFEPFGTITSIDISRDSNTLRSNGFGFVHFAEAQDALKAMEQLNGFELAGRPMKVNHITEGSGTVHNFVHQTHVALDSDEVERGGIDLGARGRLELMARLAEGTGIEIPKQVRAALANKNGSQQQQQQAQQISTQCFFLSNMFDPTTESGTDWVEEIKNDVIEECRKHGGVLHVYVDETAKEGHVYVKCATVQSALATCGALHGRWFAGRMITASFVPIQHYHNLFPDSATTTTLL